MTIVLLGANGMLGRDIVATCAGEGITVQGLDLPAFDITHPDSTLDRVSACDWVINCAAYTNVDGAESDRDAAFAVNAEGPGQVATWCAAREIPLLHVSTDYVFDGTLGRPYREDDAICPINVYGESKLAGEQAVAAAEGQHIILRTQSLFGRHGRNFVSAISARLQDGAALRVVDDQISCPTFTGHLAQAILKLLNAERQGIVHVAAEGACTWHTFACAIAAEIQPGAAVEAVTSDAYPRPAKRPAYSALDTALFRRWTGDSMPTWQKGLADYLKRGNKKEG